ncbi:MAG TPA: sigma-70 family RNA polymerase sigma factor [Solirubrobacteraceae bacterium]|jgi:RNA polymerase sigma factor (sigma-70 family)
MTGPLLRRYRAERWLRKDFPGQRTKVLAIVRSRLADKGVALGHADLEDCYSQAFAGLYAAVLEGVEVENPTGWLVTVTFRRAIDESRAAARRRIAWEELTVGRSFAASEEISPVAPHPDIAGALDDRATLRHLFEGLRSTFTRRECEAASLCYLQGLTRAEAAKQMGISETRMRKLMEGAGPGRPGLAGKVGDLLSTIKAGEWCEQQSSLMRAYALGILDPAGKRHELAVAHTRECSACRAHVASLRGLAAVLPPLPFTLLLARGGGALAGTAGGAGGGRGATTATGTVGSGAGTGAWTGAGWLGGAGSLGAKFAVVAIAAVSAGFALHGSGAHGSSGHATRGGTKPSLVSSGARSGGSLVESLTPARHGAPRRASAPRRSRKVVAGKHSHYPKRSLTAGSTPAPEFSPERVRASSTSVPTRSTSSAGEFGF